MNPTVDFGKPTSFDTALIISYLLHLLGWLFALHIARVLPLKLNGNWISYEPHVNSSTPQKKEKRFKTATILALCDRRAISPTQFFLYH